MLFIAINNFISEILAITFHKKMIIKMNMHLNENYVKTLPGLLYYKARFQIEFVFRDAKQYTGLLDCQSCKKEAIHTHIKFIIFCSQFIKTRRFNRKR